MKVLDLGVIDYKDAWDIQKSLHLSTREGRDKATLLVCSHQPVFTLGRSTKQSVSTNLKTYTVERGGDATYHGPGQVTIYPILNLNFFKKDIHWYLRQLEESVINFLSRYGVFGLRKTGLTGVWIKNMKISSIGIAVRNWITFHGLSVNIKKDDLANFKLIKPCGMDIEMTSLESLLDRQIDVNETKQSLIQNIEEALA